jgi:WD40 repeat protein
MSVDKSTNAYVVFSSDGRTLAVYGVDNMVKLYSTSTSQLMMSLSDEATVTNVAFSPDNRSLLTFNEKGEIKLWPGATDGMLSTAAK